MDIFYSELLQDSHIALSSDESKHCMKVLRHKTGDTIHVIDGKGNLYLCRITKISQKHTIAEILETHEDYGSHQFTVRMAVAPTKNMQRYEFFVEKAVELGVNEIIPILTDHSERKVVKTERIERIVLAAMKQSYKAHKPIVHEMTPFEDIVFEKYPGYKAIAHCEDGDKQSVMHIAKPTDITILIGPEGDFSLKEIQLAMENNWLPISLGPQRFRTETAAIMALHSVHSLFE
ncbi:MAG: 16S rRNA (uracil(1498)-N(3))-methyltransferase [Bacteroidales bacterium]|jgi:16S rRNA (uracil1498-N3)-methyltransferase|nr:16S rRNA (uracil(1498)-N(3))-methyltransferase [Bacteroidales bacterium]